MPHIFMDESWCLWFNLDKKRTSKYFIITFVFTDKKRSIEKIPKKIFRWFSKKQIIKRKWWVLHCNKEDIKTKNKFFKLIWENKNLKIMSVILDKRNIFTNKLKNDKTELYDYITNVLLSRIYNKNIIPNTNKNIKFIASKRETNKFMNENFIDYLNWNYKRICFSVKRHEEEKCLQIVDFCSWWIFRKYEFNDESFYNLFKNNIFEESFFI